MKLTKEDRALLKEWGNNDTDIEQISDAIAKTVYTMNDDASDKEKRISAKKALEILGREAFLSGMSRSAFHWSAERFNYDAGIRVTFDSSKLFKDWF